MRPSIACVLAAVVAALLVSGGCEPSDNGTPAVTYAAVSCTEDGACPGDELCEEGLCVPSCAADADCPEGAVCVEGVCGVDPEPVECGADADCPAGSACESGVCVFTGCDPALEVEDGVDNDCDGLVDEEPDPTLCASDADCDDGDPTTVEVCRDGACVHDPTTCEPATEVCDGLDNDCDGVVDEGCDPTACASAEDCDDGDPTTVEVCRDGVCIHDPTTCEPAEEICDGLDNDCDGAVDEECESGRCSSDADCDDGDPTTVEVCRDGVCAHDPATCEPAAEICDGLDNDCDGMIDEDCDSR